MAFHEISFQAWAKVDRRGQVQAKVPAQAYCTGKGLWRQAPARRLRVRWADAKQAVSFLWAKSPLVGEAGVYLSAQVAAGSHRCFGSLWWQADEFDAFGDRVTFWGGGVNSQRTPPFGTPEEVRAEARDSVRILGRGGGLVFTIHNVQPNVPVDNLLAMYEVVRPGG
jgi:hypothetical protein